MYRGFITEIGTLERAGEGPPVDARVVEDRQGLGHVELRIREERACGLRDLLLGDRVRRLGDREIQEVRIHSTGRSMRSEKRADPAPQSLGRR